jgi:hypothetical protein
MKKLVVLILGISLAASGMAQTDPQKKQEMKDLRTDVRERRAASHKVNRDWSHVRVKKAMRDHKAVARENRDIDKDAKRLKRQGVDHPVAKAKRQVRVQDDNRKDHTN